MSSPISGASSSEGSTPIPTNPTHPVSGAAGDYTAATQVNSMGEVKDKAPKVYDAMLMGIAQNICNRAKRSQDRIVAMMRKARSNSGG